MPTSRCERVVTVKETIDVAALPRRVPQVIPLETIYRKPRRTKTAVIGQRSGSSGQLKGQQIQAPVLHSSAVSEISDESPQSPSISDVSCASTVSSSRTDHATASVPTICQGSGNVDGDSVTSSEEARFAPNATVEMLQAGCLPGDTISVRVAINLTKHFKNPEGIILTLYRECHIDLHPAIPLGSWQSGKKQEYEDYYPKSRTGLGGLSLSSGGSSRVFRQDISQKSTALYVDKETLTANVKASVQVPEGLFPTISSVPGAMIDFKYYVETVIDLRGKSAIQERILPRLSMVNSVPSLSRSESTYNTHEVYDSVKVPLTTGLSFLETSQIRREKGVVTHVAEVIVGTRDSGRNRLKKVELNQRHNDQPMAVFRESNSTTNDDLEGGLLEPRRFLHHAVENGYHHGNDRLEESQATDFAPAHDVPPPEIEDSVDEKIRLRRAEELLLPSAPPHTVESSSQGHARQQPTAPAAFDESDLVEEFYQSGPSAPAYNRASPVSLQDAQPSAPQSFAVDNCLEDKQELERRRLQMQASSPDTHIAIDGPVLPLDSQATAPALDEGTGTDEYTPQPTQLQLSAEHPPRYQA
ncbi:MAG: hypothetical protein Q9181_000813 [Wetmoreana brouardii]